MARPRFMALLTLAITFWLAQAGWSEAPRIHRNRHRPTEQAVKLDPDVLPDGALSRIGSFRLRHQAAVIHLAFSRDGRILASVGDDNLIRLWDPASGKEVAEYRGHMGGVECLAYSPDGKLLATGSIDQTIRLWDTATGKEVRQIQGGMAVILCVAFSPDGQMLASRSGDGFIRLWKAATGAEIRQLPGQHMGNGTSNLTFSPNGQYLAYEAVDQTIRLWDLQLSKEARRLRGHQGSINSLSFCPDGKTLLSASADQTVRLWDVATGKEIREFKGHEGQVDTVFFSPDGKLVASGGEDRTVRLWDAASGKELHQLTGNENSVSEVTFSPDSKTVAAAGHDGTVRLWDVATGKALNPAVRGHSGAILAAALSPDGNILATGGADRLIILWEAASGKMIREWTDEPLAGAPAAGPVPGRIMRPGIIVFAGAVPEGVSYLAFSPGGETLASGSHDGTITLWDVQSGRSKKQLKGHSGGVNALVFAPDGKTLASAGSDQILRLWDVALGKAIHESPLPHQIWTHGGVAFSNDGRLVATSNTDNILRLCSVNSGKLVRAIPDNLSGSAAVAFSPDGRTLAAATFNTIQLWEVATNGDRGTLHRENGFLTTLMFSPDGRFLLGGGNESVINIWDLAKGRELRRLAGHNGMISMLACSADGKRMATVSHDTTTLVWDLPRLTPIPAPASGLAPDRLEVLWRDLGGQDGSKAFQAVLELAGYPKQAVAWIQEQVRPAAGSVDVPQVGQLIARLDDDSFLVRETAMRELGRLGKAAEQPLRAALQAGPSPEVRWRVEGLLEILDGPLTSWEKVRGVRAVEVLERIGNAEAREVLAVLARGAAQDRLTEEARLSLERLAKRPAATP